jgi:hypothetical protein
VKPGLAAAVLLPRIYRQESLPLGPTWNEMGADLLGQTTWLQLRELDVPDMSGFGARW